ncbi:hypothetical protein [Blastomonas fulva]|uniref:hypothetical protein n=1 Tax=Blastomonas fulva TaxID=1550728 RepID=UPI003F71DD92
MTGPVLEFLPNQAGESEGLGDAGIETFRDNPYASCGREAGQNSADAAVSHPVRLTFDVLDVATSELPGIGVLTDTVGRCLADAKQEKDLDFFSQAKKLLGETTTKVLRISDFNTKGLAGPSGEEGTPFHSLLKGAGVSNNKTETSGGSFGIGKNASFAISDLQTVFYSTAYRDKAGELLFAAQGKCRMVSHIDTNGEKRRATGYWGDPDGYVAVEDPALVPQWMRREEIGTSIFCAGFRQSDGWAWSIACSLLTNFFAALHRDSMAFEVNDGEIKLNHNTVAAMFVDPRIVSAAEADGQKGQLDFAHDLFRCLTSPDAEEVEQKVQGLGEMRFRVLVEDGLPKRVGIVRNGMLITSELQQFGDKLQRFVGTREFVAFVEPVADSASKLMKSIENPRHDSFSANRLSDPTKRHAAETAMRQLIRDLRAHIELTASIDEDEEITLDELARFFAEDASGTQPPDPDAENDPEKYVYKPARKTKTRAQRQQENAGEDGGGGDKKSEETGGKRSGDQKGPGTGTGGSGTTGKVPPLKLRGLRTAIPSGNTDAIKRTVWFTPTVTGAAVVQLEATGLNTGEPLSVVATSAGAVRKGKVEIDLKEGERISLEVTFDAPYPGPVEVFAVAELQEAAT